MQARTVDFDIKGAIFSVRLSDLVARELIVSGSPFRSETSAGPSDLVTGLSAPQSEVAQRLWAVNAADPPLPDFVDLSVGESCLEIAQYLQVGLDKSSVRDRPRLNLHINRAVAYLLMRSLQRAKDEIDAALAIDAGHQGALLLNARIRFYAGDLPGARTAIGKMQGEDGGSASILLAECCVAVGDEAGARALLNGIAAGDTIHADFIKARLVRLGQVAADRLATDVSTPAFEAPGGHPVWELAQAEHGLSCGLSAAVTERLSRLWTPLKSAQNNWYAWQVGRIKYLSGAYLGATDWYEKVAPDDSDSLPHREFVYALYRAGLMPAAERRARAIRAKNGRVVAGVTEIEADALAQAGNFLEARKLIIELISVRPKAGHLLLSLARLYAATGDADKAADCIDKIEVSQLTPELQADVGALKEELSLYLT